jgi:hypothetical protein
MLGEVERLTPGTALDVHKPSACSSAARISIASARIASKVDADETISGLLVQTRNSDDFRKIVTGIFALLMGFVIIGFFVITVFNRKLLESIFSSDAGLQFITLFAIIIAIILFGVTNILEGRELSALLGAISGYILGRSTLAAASQTGPAGVASQAGAAELASQTGPAGVASQAGAAELASQTGPAGATTQPSVS